eukprot:COSAG02_NODE_17088_length_1029_cov_2.095699_1_plen_103_part_01
MSAALLSNDLTVYDPITDPEGPAMTWSMFAVGWINAGDFNRSAGHFQRGYAPVHPPFNVWTETPNGEGHCQLHHWVSPPTIEQHLHVFSQSPRKNICHMFVCI